MSHDDRTPSQFEDAAAQRIDRRATRVMAVLAGFLAGMFLGLCVYRLLTGNYFEAIGPGLVAVLAALGVVVLWGPGWPRSTIRTLRLAAFVLVPLSLVANIVPMFV